MKWCSVLFSEILLTFSPLAFEIQLEFIQGKSWEALPNLSYWREKIMILSELTCLADLFPDFSLSRDVCREHSDQSNHVVRKESFREVISI